MKVKELLAEKCRDTCDEECDKFCAGVNFIYSASRIFRPVDECVEGVLFHVDDTQWATELE
jgi:hypothetical protein